MTVEAEEVSTGVEEVSVEADLAEEGASDYLHSSILSHNAH